MELREDNSKVILTLDKGVEMAVLDNQDYLSKAQDLLVVKILPDQCQEIPLPGIKINSSKPLRPLNSMAE